MANNITWMRHRRALEGSMHKETKTASVLSFPAVPYKIPTLSVNVAPVQDLHGQAYPYPGGGGKNLFQTTSTTETINNVTFTVAEDGSVTINGRPSATVSNYVFGEVTLPAGTYIANGFDKGASNSTRLVFLNKTTSVVLALVYANHTNISFTLDAETTVMVYPIVSASFSGNAATYYPMIRLSTIEDASFAPYENICPITGFTGANITRTGKNLFGGNALRDGVLDAMTSTDYPDERYVQFGSGYTPHKAFTADRVKFKENTQYTFIMTLSKTSGTGSNMRVYYTDGTNDNIPTLSAAQTKETLVLVTDAGKTVRSLEKINNSGSTQLYYDESGIFEGVLTADDFVAYQGNTFSIDWETEAGEVYGGTLAVNKDGTGALTINRIGLSLNGSQTWSTVASGDNKYFRISVGSYGDVVANAIISDTYKQYNIGSTNTGEGVNVYNSGGYAYLQVRPHNVANISASQFKTELTNNPILVVYQITTPVIYNLTASQVTALKGINNLWNDISQTTATYWTF